MHLWGMNPVELIPLEDFKLPKNYAWRIGMVEAMRFYQKNQGLRPIYNPPRFLAYFQQQGTPICESKEARVGLEMKHPIVCLPAQVIAAVGEKYRIATSKYEIEPPYVLIHDSWDGSCWLSDFASGIRFVTLKSALWKWGKGSQPE